MLRINLISQIKNQTSIDLVSEISENSSWGDLEYAFSNTNLFQDLGLYYHCAKLWHLVDEVNYDNGTIIDSNEILKNLNLGNDITIYIAWEEDELCDSP